MHAFVATSQARSEEVDQFKTSKLQSIVVELAMSLYSVANGLTHSGHATLSQYVGLTGTATTLVLTKSEHTGTEVNNKNITDHGWLLTSTYNETISQHSRHA